MAKEIPKIKQKTNNSQTTVKEIQHGKLKTKQYQPYQNQGCSHVFPKGKRREI